MMIPLDSFAYRIALFFLFVFFFGCANDTRTEKPSEVETRTISSTGEMVQRLNDLKNNAKPTENYHLNRARADNLVEQAKATNLPGERFNLLGKAALQYLQAGDTERTISMLSELERTSGIPKEINGLTKNFYMMQALAYLRLGEQKNCLDNHGPKNCIIPFAAEAYHIKKEGSERAIDIFSKILDAFPDDNNVRYLLNLAYMTLGKYPKEVPSKYLVNRLGGEKTSFPIFNDIAGSLGIDEMTLSGGTCVDDFDGDGDLDIFASSYGYEDQLKYFENTGSSYEDKTASTGLTGITGGLNMIHADYDNDGDKDVLVLRGGWLDRGGELPNSLIENLGNGRFKDITIESGIYSLFPTQTAVWLDFDLDGDLDLFIGNEAGSKKHPSEFFRNNGDKTFTSLKNISLNVIHKIKGCTVLDYNNDGWPDIFLSVLGDENVLFKNDKGTFRTETKLAPKFSFPTWSWDINNDGKEDLIVFSYDMTLQRSLGAEYILDIQKKPLNSEQNKIFINNGQGKFTDATERYGFNNVAGWTMGCNFGDLNNDGWLDFYMATGAPDMSAVIPNRMFLNKNGKSFQDVTSSGGFGHIQKGHGVAFADLDQDGDQDIYAVMGGAYEGDTYHNVCFKNPGFQNNFIAIELEGTTSNKSAIGARVEVTINENGGERTIHRTVNTGGSFGSSPLALHIGIGKSDRVKSVLVRWPNRKRTTSRFSDLPINTYVKITEGQNNFNQKPYDPITFKRSAQEHNHHHH